MGPEGPLGFKQPRPCRCPSLVTDAQTSAGFTDAICSTVSWRGRRRMVPLEPWHGLGSSVLGAMQSRHKLSGSQAPLHPHPVLPPLAVWPWARYRPLNHTYLNCKMRMLTKPTPYTGQKPGGNRRCQSTLPRLFGICLPLSYSSHFHQLPSTQKDHVTIKQKTSILCYRLK